MIAFYENFDHPYRTFWSHNMNFNAHLQKQVEILYVLEGELSVTINHNSTLVKPNELVIIFPNTVHSYETKNYSYVGLLIFDTSLTGDFANQLIKYKCSHPILSPKQVHPDIIYCIRAILHSQDEPKSLGLMKGYISVILGRAFEHLTLEKIIYNDHTDLTHKTLLYLAEHYKDSLTLAGLAQVLGTSKYHLSRIFSNKIGCNFNTYLNTLRIGYAQHLLANHSLSITDIAFECGFESQRTFNRTFKEISNITPSQYRKQMHTM